jgi:ubiquinone/menaquinone biosynthesis C-methylase UbiE
MIGRLLKSEIGKDNLSNRNAWIIQTLQKLPSGLKILDVGAGEMPYKPYCAHLKYTSQDFNQYDGKGDESGLQTNQWSHQGIDIVSNICAIPLPDASFDVILCSEVLEHVPDPVKALFEMDRLLSKGGKMIITTPFASLTHFSPYHFSTGFNK